jgi:putative addiction module component (TIGR02574 family)
MQKPTLEELRKLSVEDRLQLLQDVWTSLDEERDRLPIPGWHEEELERRLMSFEDNPDAGSHWPEVKKRLLERS